MEDHKKIKKPEPNLGSQPIPDSEINRDDRSAKKRKSHDEVVKDVTPAKNSENNSDSESSRKTDNH